MSDTYVVLYDPRGLIEAELPLDYDEHAAKPYRWTYDGSPLKAT